MLNKDLSWALVCVCDLEWQTSAACHGGWLSAPGRYESNHSRVTKGLVHTKRFTLSLSLLDLERVQVGQEKKG